MRLWQIRAVLVSLMAGCLLILAGCYNKTPSTQKDQAAVPGEAVRVAGAKKHGARAVSTGDLDFPAEVAGLALSSIASGQDAIQLVNDFLGSKHEVRETYIPHYKDGDQEAVFWIVEFWKEDDARDILNQMKQRIKASPLFQNYECFDDSLVENLHYARFCCDDTLPYNFFYRKQNRVYWVSMSKEKQVALLRKFMASF